MANEATRILHYANDATAVATEHFASKLYILLSAKAFCYFLLVNRPDTIRTDENSSERTANATTKKSKHGRNRIRE